VEPLLLAAVSLATLWLVAGIRLVPAYECLAIIARGTLVRVVGPGIRWIPTFVRRSYRIDLPSLLPNWNQFPPTERARMVEPQLSAGGDQIFAPPQEAGCNETFHQRRRTPALFSIHLICIGAVLAVLSIPLSIVQGVFGHATPSALALLVIGMVLMLAGQVLAIVVRCPACGARTLSANSEHDTAPLNSGTGILCGRVYICGRCEARVCARRACPTGG
jgi:hypothetical protein